MSVAEFAAALTAEILSGLGSIESLSRKLEAYVLSTTAC